MRLGELSDDPEYFLGWVRRQGTGGNSDGTDATGSWEPVTAQAPDPNTYRDAFDYLVHTLKHHHTRRPGIREAIRKAEAIAERGQT